MKQKEHFSVRRQDFRCDHGSQLVPACCAIALVRHDRLQEPLVGLIPKETKQHSEYLDILKAVAEMEYARFV